MTTLHKTVLSALQHWREHRPQQAAFHFINGVGDIHNTLSFAELAERVSRYGFYLLEHYRAGDRVAIVLPTSSDFVVAFFACLWVGIIPIPLSQPSRINGKEHLTRIFQNASIAGCITLEKTQAELPAFYSLADAHKTIRFELPPSETDSAPFHGIAIVPDKNDVAFLQYTSGSTSDPKGVMVSHGNICANHRMIREVFGHNSATKQLNWMPLYHDMGLIGHVLHPVCNGHTSYLMDPVTFVQRPLVWLESISRYGITSTGGPNFCYQHCVKRIKPDAISQLNLRSLQVAYNGAEPINPSVMDAFTELCQPQGFTRDSFLPCYGLAEATLLVSGIRHDQAVTVENFSTDKLQDGIAQSLLNSNKDFLSTATATAATTALPCLGKPAPGVDVLVINLDTLANQAPHQIGEIWVRGENIALGYWHNREATSESFVYSDDQRLLRTGDLGFMDDLGNVFITGRQKDLIIVDGKNHYPQDIEFTTQTVDELLGENACAAFTLDNNQLIIVQELKRQYRRLDDMSLLEDIKQRIKTVISQTHSLAVADIVFIDPHTLPKTTSGKIRRHLVKQQYEAQSLTTIRIQPQDHYPHANGRHYQQS